MSSLRGQGSILPKVHKIDVIGDIMTRFIMKLTQSSMSSETAQELVRCLKIRDQYEKSAQYIKKSISGCYSHNTFSYSPSVRENLSDFLGDIDELLAYIDTSG